MNQLDSLVTFIRDKGKINKLTVGLGKVKNPINREEMGDISLSKQDYLIINALKDNSRKTINDIAIEIGASTKTIRRHLDRLVEKKLVDLTIDWYPDKTSEFLSIII